MDCFSSPTLCRMPSTGPSVLGAQVLAASGGSRRVDEGRPADLRFHHVPLSAAAKIIGRGHVLYVALHGPPGAVQPALIKGLQDAGISPKSNFDPFLYKMPGHPVILASCSCRIYHLWPKGFPWRSDLAILQCTRHSNFRPFFSLIVLRLVCLQIDVDPADLRLDVASMLSAINPSKMVAHSNSSTSSSEQKTATGGASAPESSKAKKVEGAAPPAGAGGASGDLEEMTKLLQVRLCSRLPLISGA